MFSDEKMTQKPNTGLTAPIERWREFLVGISLRNSVRTDENAIDMFVEEVLSLSVPVNRYEREQRGETIRLLEEFTESTVRIFTYYFQSHLFYSPRKYRHDAVNRGSGNRKAHLEQLFMQEIKSVFQLGKPLRLTDLEYDDAKLDEDEKREFLSYLTSMLQRFFQKPSLDDADSKSTTAILVIAKRLAASLNTLETFYYLCYLFLQKVNAIREFQLARDLAEEVYLCSTKDGLQWAGLLVQFSVYTEQHNFAAALYYGSAFFFHVHPEFPIPKGAFGRICTASIQLFRNLHLYELEKRVFRFALSIPEASTQQLDNTYVSHINALAIQKDASAVGIAMQYLSAHRERILSEGEYSAFVWSVLLSICIWHLQRRA